MYTPPPPPSAEPGFFDRFAFTIKGFIIFLLSLILLIPTLFIINLISEREGRKSEAIHEVSDKWGNTQTVLGPIVAIPYEKVSRDDKGKEYSREIKHLFILPENLTVDGNINSEKRYRGIFEVVLYGGKLQLKGNFKFADALNQLNGETTLQWEKAILILGIPDLRGLEDQVTLQWNDRQTFFEPGVGVSGVVLSGIHVNLPLQAPSLAENGHNFQVEISLKGSGQLNFAPIGKVTEVSLKSNWPDPSFSGSFLPDEKQISASGFEAKWKVLNLNRNYPQAWTSEVEVNPSESTFGVDFFTPVDNYQRSERSVKYAILFICLTFLTVFFVEMRQPKRVHPFQYALIGLALVIFYILLVSISEHLPFNTSYLIAALMTVGLNTLFARSLFDSTKMALFVGGALSLLYVFLFVVLQQQDYALLIGAIGLFIILALVMYFSRQFKQS